MENGSHCAAETQLYRGEIGGEASSRRPLLESMERLGEPECGSWMEIGLAG